MTDDRVAARRHGSLTADAGRTKTIVVLISGRGSNMEAIDRASRDEDWPARVVAVISNRADGAGLGYARRHGIAAEVVEHRGYASRDAFDAALAERIDGYAPDVVALAGFMRILGADFVRRYAGRMLNIHPSLLPAFTGLDTHRRAIDAGCKVAGATVHFVTPELDHGPIVAQAAVPVLAGDTAATLAARVLEREHAMYPRAVRWLLEGVLDVEGGVVRHREGAAQLM
jgi:phosphoribosylglycinamide formyltransferase 1